jgi:two-component system, NtrC family, response regulator
VQELSPAYLAALRAHPWPGNIRELKNVIERSIILMADDGRLTPDTLPLEMQWPGNTSDPADKDLSLAAAEQQHILKVLRLAGGNKSEAARLLGIAPATLYRKLDEYRGGQ